MEQLKHHFFPLFHCIYRVELVFVETLSLLPIKVKLILIIELKQTNSSSH